jgi:predicted chitinase
VERTPDRAAEAEAVAVPAPAHAAPGALPAAPAAAHVLSLQRAAGNAAVVRWLARQPAAAPPATWDPAYGGHAQKSLDAAKEATGDKGPSSASGGFRKGRVDVPASVHDKPGGTKIASIPRGERVAIRGPEGEWYEIDLGGGKTGWIHVFEVSTAPEQIEITLEELFYVFPNLGADAEADAAVMKKAEGYLSQVNTAFKVMEIDTVEAQATYLAHSFAESDQFRRLTEATAGQKRYVEEPEDQRLDTKGLEALYPQGSDRRRTIDPIGDWSFIGRGPLQVTHRHIYIRVLAQLEKRAEALEAAGDAEGAALCREAVAAVKADPREASNPKFAFLFSAAFMKEMGGDVKANKPGAKSFSGFGPESSWMTGSNRDTKGSLKASAYRRAVEILGKKERGKT